MNIKLQAPQRRAAFTLVETMIAMGIGALLMVGVTGFLFYDSVSKMAILNYIELNQKSMLALDTMTTELREMKSMDSWSTNAIVIINANNEKINYEWDPEQKTLARKNTTLGGMAEVLLENCYEAEFQMFSAVPPAFGSVAFTPTTNKATCKMILMRWSCERQMYSRGTRNTESVQTARIVLRN